MKPESTLTLKPYENPEEISNTIRSLPLDKLVIQSYYPDGFETTYPFSIWQPLYVSIITVALYPTLHALDNVNNEVKSVYSHAIFYSFSLLDMLRYRVQDLNPDKHRNPGKIYSPMIAPPFAKNCIDSFSNTYKSAKRRVAAIQQKMKETHNVTEANIHVITEQLASIGITNIQNDGAHVLFTFENETYKLSPHPYIELVRNAF